MQRACVGRALAMNILRFPGKRWKPWKAIVKQGFRNLTVMSKSYGFQKTFKKHWKTVFWQSYGYVESYGFLENPVKSLENLGKALVKLWFLKFSWWASEPPLENLTVSRKPWKSIGKTTFWQSYGYVQSYGFQENLRHHSPEEFGKPPCR